MSPLFITLFLSSQFVSFVAANLSSGLTKLFTPYKIAICCATLELEVTAITDIFGLNAEIFEAVAPDLVSATMAVACVPSAKVIIALLMAVCLLSCCGAG
jgi:hypothetical protein